MEEKLIIAGFGGQGILFSGKLWAELMVQKGRQVTYFPSYGAEVRGGTCNCHVVVSEQEIASPTVVEATSLIVMNQPSLNRFGPMLQPGGLGIVNASMADPGTLPGGRNVFAPPAIDMARELGNIRVANVVMMGVYNAYRELIAFDEPTLGLAPMLVQQIQLREPEQYLLIVLFLVLISLLPIVGNSYSPQCRHLS